MMISGYDYSFDRLLANGKLDVVGAIWHLRELGVSAIEITDTYLSDEKIPALRSAIAPHKLLSAFLARPRPT